MCAYFCNGEQEGRAVTKKTAKSEKVLKKDAIYLFRAMLDCPGGSLFKGFRIYSFYIEILEDIGPVPEEVKTRILSEKDPEQLKKWRRAAVKAESVEQFVESMKTEKPLE